MDAAQAYTQGFVLFASAEEAWFWYCKYEVRSGLKHTDANLAVPRPCTTDDIYLALAKLYTAGEIGAEHARVLVRFGRGGRAPDARVCAEEGAARLWDEALDLLATSLIAKGIVAPRKMAGPFGAAEILEHEGISYIHGRNDALVA